MKNVLYTLAGIFFAAGLLELVRTLEIRIPEGATWIVLLVSGLLVLAILKFIDTREGA